MKTYIYILALISFTSCSLRKEINKRYPRVDREEQINIAIKNSVESLSKYSHVDLGINIPSDSLSQLITNHIKDTVLNITDQSIGVDSIRLHKVSMDINNQECLLSIQSSLYFTKKEKKIDFRDVKFTLQTSSFPYFKNDTLIFTPRFESIRVSQVHVSICNRIFRFKKIAEKISAYLSTYNENVNGLISEIKIPIKSQLLVNSKISEIIKPSESISIEDDSELIFNQHFVNGTILTTDESIQIIAAWEDTGSFESIIKPKPVDASSILGSFYKPTNFENSDSSFEVLQNSYHNIWYSYLDSIPFNKLSIQVPKKKLYSTFNSVFESTPFSLRYKFNPPDATENAKLRAKDKIEINCDLSLRNCRSEMQDCEARRRDCPECKWYQVDCHFRRQACFTENDTRVFLCQRENDARMIECNTDNELRKYKCLFAVATDIFLNMPLAKIEANINDTRGNVNFNVEGMKFNSGLTRMNINSRISLKAKTNLDIKFTPLNFGHFICLAPVDNNWNQTIKMSPKRFDLNLKSEPILTDSNLVLEMTFEKIKPLPLTLSPPPLTKFFSKPQNFISCSFTIFGLTIYRMLADPKEDKDFINQFDGAFIGKYDHDVEELPDFSIELEKLMIPQLNYTMLPVWGNNSILYIQE